MADGDTPVEPQVEDTGEESQEPTEPQEQEAEEPQEEPEPQEPEPLSEREQWLAEQVRQKTIAEMQSWQGRREKGLLEAIGQRIEQVRQPAQQQEELDPYTDPDKWFDQKLQQKQQAERAFFMDTVKSAGAEMEADPAFKGDKEFVNRVALEMKDLLPTVDRSLPPQVAGKSLLARATMNAIRKSRGQQVNPLAGNRPANAPLGTVRGKGGQPKRTVNIPKLSPEAQRLADRLNYSPEDLAKVFKD